MALTIRYKDSLHRHEVKCDEIVETHLRDLIAKDIIPTHGGDYNLLLIDLSDETELVTCYYESDHGKLTSVYLFGGAAAWNIYRSIAAIWPEINHHTAGRPPLIL